MSERPLADPRPLAESLKALPDGCGTEPADPATDHARMYVKQIDADNDGVFAIMKKNGSFVEVQIA